MKKMFKILVVFGVIFQFLSSPVYANWKEKITNNQLKAKEYISQLKAGANPDSLTRPHLRRVDKYKVKQSNKEIKKAMDEAEALARAGKHDLIMEPEFAIQGISEERAKELQNKKGKY